MVCETATNRVCYVKVQEQLLTNERMNTKCTVYSLAVLAGSENERLPNYYNN